MTRRGGLTHSLDRQDECRRSQIDLTLPCHRLRPSDTPFSCTVDNSSADAIKLPSKVLNVLRPLKIAHLSLHLHWQGYRERPIFRAGERSRRLPAWSARWLPRRWMPARTSFAFSLVSTSPKRGRDQDVGVPRQNVGTFKRVSTGKALGRCDARGSKRQVRRRSGRHRRSKRHQGDRRQPQFLLRVTPSDSAAKLPTLPNP